VEDNFMDLVPGVSIVRRLSSIACVVLALIVGVPSAHAQTADVSRWGLQVSFVPTWKANDGLSEGLQWAPEGVTHEGSEFLVGFIKGTTRGREWGVSYVRKPIKDSVTTQTQTDSFCPSPTNCVTLVDEFTQESRNVVVDGVEAHFFIPFATFADRVQIGANLGGGVGFSSGTVTSTSTFTTTSTNPPGTTVEVFTDEESAAGEVIGKTVVLIKAEFQAAFVVAPGLKIRAAVGLNAPSAAAFRIGVSYLFGNR
jgi:hypothetical protein